ncbi:MAG TPA: carboxypeptidase-like regulatory domain-containing protein, partial [Terriglobales bacterium]|nr:carboxypeptidase-like regulatory domain-containing protein [Terriglobales bacterium]
MVTDASGAAVVNAPLTVTNKATGSARAVLTDISGSFSVPALAAGDYEVKVTMVGFSTLMREASVETGGTTTVGMKLEVGATQTVVNVEAASAQMEYEHNAIESVITQDKVEKLPLNGRSFLQLAELSPGVTISPGTT